MTIPVTPEIGLKIMQRKKAWKAQSAKPSILIATCAFCGAPGSFFAPMDPKDPTNKKKVRISDSLVKVTGGYAHKSCLDNATAVKPTP